MCAGVGPNVFFRFERCGAISSTPRSANSAPSGSEL